MRPSLLPILVMLAVAACDESFEMSVLVNDYTDGAYEITINGAPLDDTSNNSMAVTYDSENDAVSHPIVIETWRDGVVVDRCELYGRCRDGCQPTRVRTSVCAGQGGQISLNTWSCPCDGEIADWFCGGDCAETAP